ncbi:MAG: rhodanese-like domain-containing protein [Solirubrobacteraceae bacterium]
MNKNTLFSLFVILIAGITVFMFSRFSSLQEITSLEINQIKEIDFNNSNNVLLDVRTLNEYNQGHILKAKNIDVMNFEFEEALKKENKNASFYIYCRSGSRSIKAYNLMKNYGFKKIVNLEGGIQNFKGELTQ